ncbi:two-component regulator propeller domain-containing protein [Sorangium sp. So ce834]|uniref:two-component regulator propeller domain-containing protein n=1 Tax=Sorangium sp. So ce834 TaxID=3133321 RepID=UPI003F6152EB
MRAAKAAVAPAALVLLLGTGCPDEPAREASATRAVENPRLAAWNLPPTNELAPSASSVIYSDQNGTLWFGTAGGGVNRFDPQTRAWSIYKNKSGISDVQAIATSSDGGTWFGTSGSGVTRFDSYTRSWSTYTAEDGLVEENIIAIAEGSDGSLWLGLSSGGIARFAPQTRSWSTYTAEDGPGDSKILSIMKDRDGMLWFGTAGRGASRLNPKTNSWSIYNTKNDIGNNNVFTITQDRNSIIWFGTSNGGVSRFDPKTSSWSIYNTEDDLSDADIKAIAHGPDGSVWLGTWGRGVRRHDRRTLSWSAYNTNNGLTSNYIQAIAQGPDGSLWFGTWGGGVHRYDPKALSWSAYNTNSGLTSNYIRTMASDRDGSIWFGTWGEGVSQFESATRTWSAHLHNGPAEGVVQAVTQDADGALWFGTSLGGVSRFIPKTRSWVTYTTKDGLADNNVQAIAQDADGTLWFGTLGRGVSRFNPKTRSWVSYTTKDGLADNNVQAIAQDADGAMWFGTSSRGACRFDPRSRAWSTYDDEASIKGSIQAILRDADGAMWFGTKTGALRLERNGSWTKYAKEAAPRDADVRAIAQAADGSLWFGTRSDGAIRLDRKTRTWSTYTVKDGLAGDDVLSIAQDASGAVWVATTTGTSRLVLGRTKEVGTAHTISAARTSLAADGDSIAISQFGRLSTIQLRGSEDPKWSSLPPLARGTGITTLVTGPSGITWVGTDLSGLILSYEEGDSFHLTGDGSLPSNTVTALAAVPGTGSSRVWVGTTAGLAVVALRNRSPHVERVDFTGDQVPIGPVDALAAADDGSVFVAYNAIPEQRYLVPALAQHRSKTRIFRVSAQGAVLEIETNNVLAGSEVRALAFSAKDGLWAGTSVGLFLARDQAAFSVGERHDGFRHATADMAVGRRSIRRLAIAPDEPHTVWMGVDRQGNMPALVIGYRPETHEAYMLKPEDGVPQGDTIDNLALTASGELIVQVASMVARGPVFVRVDSNEALIARVLWIALTTAGLMLAFAALAIAIVNRRNLHLHTSLAALSLSSLPSALTSMRRFRVLDECWSHLGLPRTRIPLIEALASPAPNAAKQLRALAELLGMEGAASAPVQACPHSLSVLAARLPYPAPVRGHTVALVSLDVAEAESAEPAHLRAAFEVALKEAGQRFELPFVLLARDDVERDLLPADLGSLRLGERELKSLLFARNPQHTFAGLLHARRLVALSPYATAGEVKDEQMFFGRVALLKELLLASSIQHIVIGPRRVGKTSLLKRLLRELPARRPDVDAVFVDLLGIADHGRAARMLARTLKTDVPRDHDPDTAFADLLRARFQDGGRKGVVLIDEADGLIQADAALGFPLLAAMRTLQAEEICSFVLAGYLFLYRESLNQRSPLYNFASVRMLGPLEPEAARDLALVPMQRLGVAYADPELPARIAERTGGYPSFVQVLCDAELDVLRDVGSGDLVLSAGHLAQAERKVGISLRDIFRSNAGDEAQLLVYRLLDRDDFTAADAESALADALGRAVPAAAIDSALQELRLFGFLIEQDGIFSFAIPLLRDTLRTGDPARTAEQLAAALSRSG